MPLGGYNRYRSGIGMSSVRHKLGEAARQLLAGQVNRHRLGGPLFGCLNTLTPKHQNKCHPSNLPEMILQ